MFSAQKCQNLTYTFFIIFSMFTMSRSNCGIVHFTSIGLNSAAVIRIAIRLAKLDFVSIKFDFLPQTVKI